MNPLGRSTLDAGLRWSPVQTALQRRASRRLAVLAYHGIEDPEQFEVQAEYLRRFMHPVSLGEVVEASRRGGGLPRNTVLITFDDGDRSVFDEAMPILRDRGMPGAVFVITSTLGTEDPWWWVEVEERVRAGAWAPGVDGHRPEQAVKTLKRVSEAERRTALDELRRTSEGVSLRVPQLRAEELPLLESAGIEVGNHTVSHAILPGCSDAELETEIRRAHEAITACLGYPPRGFAYPNGDWDPRAAGLVRDLGYEVAFLFDHQLAGLPIESPMLVSRLRVNSTTSMNRLRIILSGLHPALHRLRGGS